MTLVDLLWEGERLYGQLEHNIQTSHGEEERAA